MKKLIKLFAYINVLFMMLSLSACQTPQATLRTMETKNKLVYEQGKEVSISDKKLSSVLLTPKKSIFPKSGKARFFITVKNNGKQDTVISSTNITATSSDGTLLHIFTHEELVDAVHRKEQIKLWGARLSMLGAAMDAGQNGGYIENSGSFNSNTNGSFQNNNGSGGNFDSSGSGTYSGTTYSPELAQLAQDKAIDSGNRQISRIQQESQLKINQLNSEVLKIQTVRPGNTYGSSVVIAMPEKSGIVMIDVSLNGELHSFTYYYHVGI